VKFDLSEADSKTVLRLEHTGFPEEAGNHLEGGWQKMYWDPLKAFLA